MKENDVDANDTGCLWVVSQGGDYDGSQPIAIRDSTEKARERAEEEIPGDVEFEEYNRENGTYLARWRNHQFVVTRPIEDIEVGRYVDTDTNPFD